MVVALLVVVLHVGSHLSKLNHVVWLVSSLLLVVVCNVCRVVRSVSTVANLAIGHVIVTRSSVTCSLANV